MSHFGDSSDVYSYEDSEDSGYDMSFKSETTDDLFDDFPRTPKKESFLTPEAEALYQKFNGAFHASLNGCNINYSTPTRSSDYYRQHLETADIKTNLFGNGNGNNFFDKKSPTRAYQEFYTSTPVKRKPDEELKDVPKSKRRYATGRNRVSRAKSPTQVHFL